MTGTPNIAVFGASGLIGEAVSRALLAQGFLVTPVARHFSASQRAAFDARAVERAIMDDDAAILSRLLSDSNIDIAVNCVGVLRDGGRGRTDAVHREFVKHLLEAMAMRGGMLIHISIPGDAVGDITPFSRSKRQAESIIATAPVASIILRPGFVIAQAAYGGSALMRTLAMTPIDFPQKEAARPFMTTAVSDIAQTITFLAQQWQDGRRNWKESWDVMSPDRSTVGDVLRTFRKHFGGPQVQFTLPSGAMTFSGMLGDLTSLLGWAPPVGRTSIAEMRRGIAGDPQVWMTTTGIAPASLEAAMQFVPATVQEKWFARLYLLKPLIVGILVTFWCISGLIALTVAFDAATSILTTHHFPLKMGRAITFASSCVDITVGMLIAFRRTCRFGLLAGIGVSLFYMISAAFLTPEMWFEPLGALVKTFPSMVLGLVLLAIWDDR